MPDPKPGAAQPGAPEPSADITSESYANEPVKYSALEVVDLATEAAAVSAPYRNLVVYQVNRSCLRLAVFNEVFRWHLHPTSDELFLVVEGELAIDRTIHRTRAIGRTANLCFEELAAETVFVDAPIR